MKALVDYGSQHLSYEEVPDPVVVAGTVAIRVGYCAICGTDLHVYRGLPSSWPVPGIRGHEIAGVVTEVGGGVSRIAKGDRVVVQPLRYCGACPACRDGRPNLCYNMALIGGEHPGGFAEQIVVPQEAVFPIPDGLSLDAASCAEPLATPVHALRRNMQALNETAAIFGAGAQGLLALQIVRLMGVTRTFITDVNPHRLAIASELGATRVINTSQDDPIQVIQRETGGYGVELAIDTAGVVSARQQLIASLRRGGTGIFIAIGGTPTPIDFMAIGPGELSLCGSQCYSEADFQIAINLLSEKKVDVQRLTSIRPLRDGASVFANLVSDPRGEIKVLLT